MMESLEIGSTPALLSGPESESVFLFVHGLHGNKRLVVRSDAGLFQMFAVVDFLGLVNSRAH